MKLTQQPQLAVGVLGLGMLQIVSLFESTAPSLQELRSSPENDAARKQELLDATLIVGTLTVFVSVIANLATNSVLPGFIFIGGLSIVAAWHYMVLTAPQV